MKAADNFRVAMVLTILTLAIACSKTKSPPANLFPESNEVSGWTKSGATRSFPADRLYEYIDGDADKYVQAGVGDTLTADYIYNQKVEAAADIFVMSGAAGATKVFDASPASGSQAAQVGDSARLYQGSLMFRKGRYFVRLVAYQDDPKVGEALTALGRAIANKLD